MTRSILDAAWLKASVIGGLLAASTVSSAAAYDVVLHGGKHATVTSLAFSGSTALLGGDDGRRTIDAMSIDFYETFQRNLGQAGGNLVVFKTGSLLRFEKLEMKDGAVTVHMAGGATFVVSESLVDFEGSVREGAMLRLPSSALASVAVSRGGARGPATAYGDDDPSQSEEASVEIPADAGAIAPPSTARPVRPGRPGYSKPRRFGGDRGPEASPDAGEPERMAPSDDVAMQMPPQDQGESVPVSAGPGQNQGEQQSPEGTGQTVLIVATTFSGEIGGLQVTVTFPPNLKAVQPIAFSGFASSLAMPMVNANVPGQVTLAAVNGDPTGPGVQSGGEFLRLTFAWSGRSPTAQQFSVAVRATDPLGADVPEFPREISIF